MSSLPSVWIEPAISEVAEVNPRKDVDLSTSDLVSFVPMAAVDEVSGTIVSPVDRPYGEVSKGFTHFRDDDVIFAKITPSMENGKSAVARGLTNGTGMGSTEFHVFRSYGAIEPEYLWRFIRQKSFRENAQAVMSGAVGQQRVPADYLKEHLIPLPPLPEQRRIVAKVDGLTARTARARKELDRIPTLIARYKQRLLALAADGLLTRIWREENGGRTWQATTVEKLAETTFDGPFGSNLKSADYVDNGVRVVRLENIGSLRFIREKETYISEAKFKSLQRHELKPDDVLFSSFIAEEIRVCLLPDDLDTIAINKADCFCVRVDRNICLPKFLAYRLASPTCYEVLKEAVHGATRPRISLGHLKQFEIELPPLEEQAEIVRRIESAFGWLDRMAADHAAAARLLPKLDAAILGKAFRGELVPQDPDNEPAAKLLDRIKAERAATAAKPQKSGRGRPPKGDKVILASIDVGLKAVAYGNSPRPKGNSGMTKSRQDEDVMGKPYLAGLLKSGRLGDAQSLFRAADLPVADFYKQLAWEIDKGHILDNAEELKAA
jgi:type I restriction enzyme, S subunit